jgi:hypothetical protein
MERRRDGGQFSRIAWTQRAVGAFEPGGGVHEFEPDNDPRLMVGGVACRVVHDLRLDHVLFERVLVHRERRDIDVVDEHHAWDGQLLVQGRDRHRIELEELKVGRDRGNDDLELESAVSAALASHLLTPHRNPL